ncbi:MAG TPA: hypothetical protein VFF06_00405 [Polyangia bacterium]|nr:hypothetical protein [Polyangia bacterium]
MRLHPAFVCCALIGSAHAEPSGPVAIDISFEVTHEPNGRKYPNQLKERYTLDSDGKLHYSAYFGGMPIDLNHNDDAEWAARDSGRRVLATVNRLLGDPASGLHEIPDSESPPDGAYVVTVREHDADSTRVVNDRRSRAWSLIDARFRAMVAAFEKATGRPKKPSQLPQARER